MGLELFLFLPRVNEWTLGKARQCRKNGTGKHTLDTNMNVVLRLLGLPCVFVGFGEGVYRRIAKLVIFAPPTPQSQVCDVAIDSDVSKVVDFGMRVLYTPHRRHGSD